MQGRDVALVGLEPERLEALAAELGDRAAALEADVTDYEALSAPSAPPSSASARSTSGSPTPASLTPARWRAPRSSRSSARSPSTCSACGVPTARVIGQITERRGYLLNISSLSAVAHAPLMGAYTTAKAGVEALTHALRMEAAPSGARVGCAYFGFIDTDSCAPDFAQPRPSAERALPSFLIGRRPSPKVLLTRSSGASNGVLHALCRRAGSAPSGCCVADRAAADRTPNDAATRTASRESVRAAETPRGGQQAMTRCSASRRRRSRSARLTRPRRTRRSRSPASPAPMIATIAGLEHAGTCQPHQVTPGSSARRARGRSQVREDGRRIGSTA